MLLVLWDLDGTLVDTAPHGRHAFADAFREVVGRPAERYPALSGRTDTEIALDLLELNGVEGGERLLSRFCDALAAALAEREDTVRREGRVLPGAREAIAALDREPSVVQSLLTGNIRPNAVLKLASFGLGEGLDLEVGGYGSDDRRRPHLVTVARRRAEEKYGARVAPERTVLIGDTPLDVAAAREAGARSVAVAGGQTDRAELEDAGPDALLADLTDTGAVVAAVRGGRGT